MTQSKIKLSYLFMLTLAFVAAFCLSCKNNDATKEVASASPETTTSHASSAPGDKILNCGDVAECMESMYTSWISCVPENVFVADSANVPTKGIYLVYTPPTTNNTNHVSLYGWTDFGNNGKAGWQGFHDTEWQLLCIAEKTNQNAISCPLPKGTYMQEIQPMLAPPETVKDCSVYRDAPEAYLCKASSDPDQAYCEGTWQIWHDGAMVSEYQDAAKKNPPKDSHFRKLTKKVSDSETYTAHLSIVWE